jgi:uncharacterized protein YutE (UPF0331/DUF86 family)
MDKKRILVKLDLIEQYLQEIETILPPSAEEYSQDPVRRRALERLIQITIEAVMDVSAIIVKELKLGLPSQEVDILEKMSDKVLNPELILKLRRMKSFRNVLVHGYAQVNDQRVYEILARDMGDITEFKEEITEFLRKTK